MPSTLLNRYAVGAIQLFARTPAGACQPAVSHPDSLVSFLAKSWKRCMQHIPFRKGAFHDPSSSTHADRRHASAQPLSTHTIHLRSLGIAVRATLRQSTGPTGAGYSLSGRRRRANALASVRRSNCTYSFPVCSFHEDTSGRRQPRATPEWSLVTPVR